MFAQDSWKIKPNLTLEFGVRAGFWTNNGELNDFGGYFDAVRRTTRTPACSSTRAPIRASTAGDTRHRGRRRRAASDNRSPFAMPRVNVAWDIDGQGNNVLRGGFGMFYNRNMGNLEYSTLRVPPISYRVGIGSGDASNLGGGVGLTYDTLGELDWRTRVSSINLDTLNPDSNKWPKTYSYSVSYARRIFFNQVD